MQLNTGRSIVDSLKSTGADSSFSGRAKLAAERGITNYTGTAAQNMQLLRGNTPVAPGVFKGAGGGFTNSSGSSLSFNPVMQTTSVQGRQDSALMQRAEAVTTQQGGQVQNMNVAPGVASPTQPTTPTQGAQPTDQTTFQAPNGGATVSLKPATGSFVYQTPTTLQEGQKTGYGSDGKRYIVNKDGSVENDTFADQEYETNKAYIQKEKERNDLYTSIQATADASHGAILEATKQQYAVRRQKMEDINKRYLGLQTQQGFDGGQARFMADVNNGVLADNEIKGELRLSELDAEEKMIIAQIQQAKTAKDFEALSKRMAELDNIGIQKQEAIQNVFKSAREFNKAIDDQQREIIAAEKLQFTQGTKALETAAPALIQSYDALKTTVEKQSYVNEMAKRLGISPEMVLGEIEKQRSTNQNSASLNASRDRSNQPKVTGTETVTDEFGKAETPAEKAKKKSTDDFFSDFDYAIETKATFGKDIIPLVTAKGYLTFEGFKQFWGEAKKVGIERDEFITRYASKLNKDLLTSTRKGYDLTKKEYELIKKTTK